MSSGSSPKKGNSGGGAEGDADEGPGANESPFTARLGWSTPLPV